MIIETIIQEIAGRIAENLPFVTRSGGLVREAIVNWPNSISQRLPAALCAPFSAESKLQHMTPDDQDTVIVWFSSTAGQVVASHANSITIQNEVTMVVWLNTRRFVTDDAMSAEIALINQVRNTKPFGNIRAINVKYVGDGQANLNQWSFDEKNTQMTMPPYRIAAHRFIINYAVSLNCPDPVVITTPQC